MAIRVLVSGASGKMGQCVVKAIQDSPDFVLAGTASRTEHLLDSIQQYSPDVVVDFTHPDVAFQHAKTIIEQNVHPVIGTTGFSRQQIGTLQAACAAIGLGGLIAPNFSLGTVLMIKYAAEMAKYFSDIEIIEMHHAGKKDSPSGTALYTAAALSDKPIPIHSVRLPGLIAHQQILFGGLGETVTFRQDTSDRQCFMPGVLLACTRAMTLDRLVYGLEELL